MVLYTEKAVIKAMKIQSVILKAAARKISWLDAAMIIGVSARTMRRWKARYERFGYDDLFDRRGKIPSPKRVPFDVVKKILKLYQDEYHDFSVKHFHEQLIKDHNIQLSYQWVKTALQTAGLVSINKKRGPHRKMRERKPMAGMMLFCDGSMHKWMPLLDNSKQDLILFCDDATSEVYSAYLVDQEGTLSVMQGIKEIIKNKGTFCSFYTDRGSHFFNTPKQGQMVDKSNLTQIGRALKHLGIEHIPSYCPQGRGRIERMFATWQRRLPPELRRAGIKSVAEANDYIAKKFLPQFNQKFTVAAKEEDTAFIPISGVDLDSILCIQHDRVVNNDNTVSFGNKHLQIHPVKWKCSFAKCNVKVCEHLDSTISIRFGNHILGAYSAEGNILQGQEVA